MPLFVPQKMVYPSAGRRVTCSAATELSPPGRFSTTTGWPSCSASAAPTIRVVGSAEPPGGKPTIKRMGLEGYGCASALLAARTASAAAKSLMPHCSRDRFTRKPCIYDQAPAKPHGHAGRRDLRQGARARRGAQPEPFALHRRALAPRAAPRRRIRIGLSHVARGQAFRAQGVRRALSEKGGAP